MAAIGLNIVSKFNDKGVKQAQSAFKGLGASVAGIAGALGGIAAVSGLVNFGKQAILGAEAAETANQRIGQIAESMGIFGESTAQVTKDLIAYAEANEFLFAVDADVIKATQAKLLTFKELATSAGEVGGSFERATQAAIDLAAAGFGAAETNAVQLGKALNDPIKGITALTRSGITFTQAEKDKIETLMESGRVLEAQNLILTAIETQVGGTAEATADASVKMDLAFKAMQDSIGEALLPTFQAFAEEVMTLAPEIGTALKPIAEDFAVLVSERLIPALQDFATWLGSEEGRGAVSQFVTDVGNALTGIADFIGFISENSQMLTNLAIGLGGAAIAFGIYTTAANLATAATTLSTAAAMVNPFVALAAVIIGAGTALSLWSQQVAADRDAASGYAGRLGEIYGEFARLDELLETGVITHAEWRAETAAMTVELGMLEGSLGATSGELNRFNNLSLGKLRGELSATNSIIMQMYHSGVAASAVFEGVLDKSGRGVDFKIPELVVVKNDFDNVSSSVGGLNKALNETVKTVDKLAESTKASEQNMINWAASGPQIMAQAKEAFNAATAQVEAHNAAVMQARDSVASLLSSYRDSFRATDSMSAMESAAVSLASGLRDVLAATDSTILSKKNNKKLSAFVDSTEAEMRRVAKLQENVADRIKEVEGQRSAMGSVFDNIYNSIIGDGDITRFSGSAKNIVKQLQQSVDSAREFQQNLIALREAGLSQGALQQIQEGGVSGGGQTAKALLQGGAGAIEEVNALLGELDAIAFDAGNRGVESMYGVGLGAVDSLIDGLYGDQDRIDAAAENLAQSFSASFQRAFEKGTPLLTAPSLEAFIDYFNTDLANVKAVTERWEEVSTPAPGGGRQFGYSPDNLMRIGLPVPVRPIPTPQSDSRINITINAGIGTNGAELGRVVVDAISRYENTSGKVFARA